MRAVIGETQGVPAGVGDREAFIGDGVGGRGGGGLKEAGGDEAGEWEGGVCRFAHGQELGGS